MTATQQSTKWNNKRYIYTGNETRRKFTLPTQRILYRKIRHSTWGASFSHNPTDTPRKDFTCASFNTDNPSDTIHIDTILNMGASFNTTKALHRIGSVERKKWIGKQNTSHPPMKSDGLTDIITIHTNFKEKQSTKIRICQTHQHNNNCTRCLTHYQPLINTNNVTPPIKTMHALQSTRILVQNTATNHQMQIQIQWVKMDMLSWLMQSRKQYQTYLNIHYIPHKKHRPTNQGLLFHKVTVQHCFR